MTTRLTRSSRIALCALALLGAPGAALATPIMTIDELVGHAALSNSGDDTEMAALRTLTGIDDLVLDSKIDVDKHSTATPATGITSAWMLSDVSKPGYFALKFGTGKTNATSDTFFFKNIGDLTQLVWTNEQVQFLTGGNCAANPNKCQIGRLSHYVTSVELLDSGNAGGDSNGGSGGSSGGGSGGSGSHELPEPAGLALLALGALAAAGTRRRQARA